MCFRLDLDDFVLSLWVLLLKKAPPMPHPIQDLALTDDRSDASIRAL